MATITWTGAAGDGNYNNPANWSPMQVPGAGDTATISQAAASAIGINNTAAAASLTTSKNITLTLANGQAYTFGSGTGTATFSNGGTFVLNSNYNLTDLVIGGAKLNLSGGGTIVLGNYGEQNRIYGASGSDILNNVNNLIEGAGQLGAGQLTFINAASGVVDANVSNQLIINTGSVAVSNAGLLEATAGSGGLVIQSSVTDTAGGQIAAAGGNVYLQNGAILSGGTLSSNGGGAIDISNSATLSGLTNTGTVALLNNTTLALLGTITNSGTIAIESNYNNTDLVISNTGTVAGTVTLTGNGTIAMGDYSNNRLYGALAGDTLVNLNNTIEGAGQFGVGQLTLVNDATIDATGGNVLYFNTTGTATNNGLIEATGPGGLVIQSAIDSHGGGTILAAGSTVSLSGATLAGGLVTSSSVGTLAGAVVDTGGATLDGSAHLLTNTGIIDVNNNEVLTLAGTISNHGTIALNSNYNVTDLNIGTSVVLNGGGSLLLGDYGNQNQIQGTSSTATLDNVNDTISGAGVIGAGTLSVVNESAGVIDATGGNSLIIVGGMTNHGLIEATGAGGVSVQTTIANTGTLLAAGSNIYLNGADIAGGQLTSTTVGTISGAFVDNGGATLDGSAATLTDNATIDVNNNQVLTLIGTITNHGTIALNSNYNVTDLNIGTNVVLNGGGAVLLGDYGNQNQIQGTSSAATLDNIDNTISGAGAIGAGTLSFINEAAGVVNANTADNSIILLASTATNNGLIEATGSGGLTIEDTVANSGTILAAGGNVTLNGGTIEGGLVSSTGPNAIVDQSNGTLSGLTLAAGTVVDENNNQYLTLLGTITNHGTIAVNSNYNNTDLVAGGTLVTLTGGGGIVLGNYGQQNRIYGSTGATVLDNINNTISGAGQLGAGQLTFINEKAGIVDANFSGNEIIVNSASAITNSGLMEATAGATLLVQTAIDSSSGGTVLASGGTVNLSGGAILGGMLISNNGGSVEDSSNGTLDGSAHAVTFSGLLNEDNNQYLYLKGAITNNGTISVNSNYNNTDLVVDSPTLTLSGNGTITLGDYGEQDRLYGASASDVLKNVGNTINGGGQLGAGQLTLVNSGTIAATGTNALIVNLGSTGTNTATGQMLGVGAGGLVFQNGTYTNSGLIQAGSGSAVTFQSGAVLTNDGAGVLSGGTYGAVSAGGTFTATTSITGAAVVTDDANIVLSGAGSTLSFGGVAIETSLKTIGKGDSLSVLGGRAYTTKNAIANSGTLALGGGVFTDKSLNDKATATLSGFGTLAGNLTSAGTIAASGGTLELDGKANSITGAVSGSGTLAFSKGISTLGSGTTLGVGSIALINAATLNIASPVSFGGTFDISAKSFLAGSGTFTNTGLFEQTGRGLATVSDPFANVGTISVANGGTLAFSGGLANTGLITDSGVFTDTAALTGGSLNVGAGASATLASTASAPSTLATLTTAGTVNLNGTLTVTGDYNDTASGSGNSYTPFAGITGTVDGQGTQLAVIGVNGTTITSVNGTLTIAVKAGGTARFEIENTGAAGSAALRGALQTTVNGGSINGSALSGSGVTASNFGPIAAGAASSIYTIHYSSGALTGEAIHIASDFANVAGLTIDIVPAGNIPATAPALSRDLHHTDGAMAWLPSFHQL